MCGAWEGAHAGAAPRGAQRWQRPGVSGWQGSGGFPMDLVPALPGVAVLWVLAWWQPSSDCDGQLTHAAAATLTWWTRASACPPSPAMPLLLSWQRRPWPRAGAQPVAVCVCSCFGCARAACRPAMLLHDAAGALELCRLMVHASELPCKLLRRQADMRQRLPSAGAQRLWTPPVPVVSPTRSTDDVTVLVLKLK